MDIDISRAQITLKSLLNLNDIVLEPLKRGHNGRVYKVNCNNSKPSSYIIKFYFQHIEDKRDRLSAEFKSLQFLWDHGVRCIPRPIVMDSYSNFAVYEYIDGMPILSLDVTEADINQSIKFILKLKGLSHDPKVINFSNASEACFSFDELVLNIQNRFNQFETIDFFSSEENKNLFNFLSEHLRPAFKHIIRWERMDHFKIDNNQKMLSPSDFGFHNALRRSNGEICFLDFEYFGWDDPAKMISDFILHPAMDLHKSLKKQFLEQALMGFSKDCTLVKRIEVVYPLYGLKWCLIMLNEFLPQSLLRRQFASSEKLNIKELQRKQLTKAHQMLDKILEEYEHFSELYLS